MATVIDFPARPWRFSSEDLELFGQTCEQFGRLLGWEAWRLTDYGDGPVIEAQDRDGDVMQTVLKDDRGRYHSYDWEGGAARPDATLAGVLSEIGIPVWSLSPRD